MQKDHNKSNLEKLQPKAQLKTQMLLRILKSETEIGNWHFHSSFKGKQIFLTTALNSTFTQPSEDDVWMHSINVISVTILFFF